MVRTRLRARRLGGLTLSFVGLLGGFAALTLTALGRSGAAGVVAIAGFALAVTGLRVLPRRGP